MVSSVYRADQTKALIIKTKYGNAINRTSICHIEHSKVHEKKTTADGFMTLRRLVTEQ